MGKRLLVVLLAVVLGVSLWAAACGDEISAAPDASADPSDVLTKFTSDAESGLPGVVAGVIKNGEVIYEGAAGVRTRGNPEPVTISDSFHIGSDTKAMTALLCGILVDRGLLSWTTTIGEVLGSDYPMRDEYRAVTLEQLLSHEAGFPHDLPNKTMDTFFPYDSTSGADRPRMVKEILSLAPEFSAGSLYQYSNLGYVVAGFMAETVTGKTWESLMQEEIFTPLGMTSAGFGPPAKGKGDSSSPGAPWGHSPRPVDPASAYADNPAAYGPCGTVHASLQDLEKYLPMFWSSPVEATGSLLVSQSVVDELIRARLSDVAFGWGVFNNSRGDVCIAHDGSNGMFYCAIRACPSEKSAVVVMTNRGEGQAMIAAEVGELTGYFAEHFLGW